MSDKKFYIGIDLGTTNSTVSVVNIDKEGKIVPKTLEVEQLDDYGLGFTYDAIVPSALYIDDNGDKNVGRYAIKMLDTYPKRVLKEAKRHIGVLRNGKTPSWDIDGEIFTPEVVSSYVLKKLKKDAEKYLQQEVDSVVITVPANFNFNQVGATRTAAKFAGFDPEKIYTLAEPTAALIDYLNEEREKAPSSRRLDVSQGKKTLLVFDLGGGTCDVSIMEVNEDKNGQINIQELSISQYTELGGVDFDDIVVNKLLLPQLAKAKGLTPMQIRSLAPEIRIMLQSNLKKIAENTKKTFTRIIKSKVEMNGENYFENSQAYDNIRHREMTIGLPSEYTHTFEITKKMYDDCIKVFLYESETGRDIETPIKNAIKHATKNITMDSIDEVFLVGGMTNYPTIQERIYEIFNKRIKPVSSINPMYSVSRGASVYNYYKDKINLVGPGEGENDEIGTGTIDVGSILPDNVYINVVTGDPIALLEKGTKEGSSRIIEDRFVVSGRVDQETISEMELELFSAESPTSMKITELESAVLRFRKPVKSGTKITIKAEYTSNREVIVSAWLKDDESEKIDVTIGESKISPEKEKEIKESDVK